MENPGVKAGVKGGWRSVPQRRRLQDFNPVIIRIANERHVVHAAFMQALLEGDAEALKPLAGGAHVRHRDAQVAKAARLAVAVVVVEIGLIFGAVVMGQFENARLAQRPAFALVVVLRDLFTRAARQVADGKAASSNVSR